MNASRQNPPSPQDRQRRALVRRVVSDAIARGWIGDPKAEESLLATRQYLLPELAHEISAARVIHSAAVAAASAQSNVEPIEPLSEEQLEKPIDASLYPASILRDVDDPPEMPGYLLPREISRGGQATVYEAVHKASNQRVAVKVIPGGPFTNPRTRSRFEKEALVLANLEHPNIVHLVDRGRTADGSFFFAMEYIEGLPLDEYLKHPPKEDPIRRVVKLFTTIARAIDSAHRKGIVHRDLKPSNIRVDETGRPHILDFGFADLMLETPKGAETSQAKRGHIVGSLPWASPEQASCDPTIDGRSDVYSLGVMLFRCLTGEFPYEVNGSILQVLETIVHTPPKHARYTPANLRISSELDAIIQKALAKRPKARYPRAADFARDLEDYLCGRPTSMTRLLRRMFWMVGRASFGLIKNRPQLQPLCEQLKDVYDPLPPQSSDKPDPSLRKN